MPSRLAGSRDGRPTRAQPGSAALDEARTGGTSWTERILRTLAAVFLVTWSFRLSGYLTFGPWLAIPVVLLGLTGLLAIVVAWLPQGAVSRRRQRQVDVAVLVAVIAGLGLWSYFQVYIAPDYGTDEIAFDQYAAQLALHGINPYLHSMANAFPLFHVSPNGYTFQLNGQPVTQLSYPALAFEEYLPLLFWASPPRPRSGPTSQPGRSEGWCSTRSCRGSSRRWLPSWSASTCSPGTRSAGSRTSCSSRC